jgi:hypothetical protein
MRVLGKIRSGKYNFTVMTEPLRIAAAWKNTERHRMAGPADRAEGDSRVAPHRGRLGPVPGGKR